MATKKTTGVKKIASMILGTKKPTKKSSASRTKGKISKTFPSLELGKTSLDSVTNLSDINFKSRLESITSNINLDTRWPKLGQETAALLENKERDFIDVASDTDELDDVQHNFDIVMRQMNVMSQFMINLDYKFIDVQRKIKSSIVKTTGEVIRNQVVIIDKVNKQFDTVTDDVKNLHDRIEVHDRQLDEIYAEIKGKSKLNRVTDFLSGRKKFEHKVQDKKQEEHKKESNGILGVLGGVSALEAAGPAAAGGILYKGAKSLKGVGTRLTKSGLMRLITIVEKRLGSAAATKLATIGASAWLGPVAIAVTIGISLYEAYSIWKEFTSSPEDFAAEKSTPNLNPTGGKFGPGFKLDKTYTPTPTPNLNPGGGKFGPGFRMPTDKVVPQIGRSSGIAGMSGPTNLGRGGSNNNWQVNDAIVNNRSSASGERPKIQLPENVLSNIMSNKADGARNIGTLKQQRARFQKEIDENPELRNTLAALAISEEGTKSSRSQSGVVETMMNRASAQGKTLSEIVKRHSNASDNYYAPYFDGAYDRNTRLLENNPKLKTKVNAAIDEVLAGSNYSNFGTDNASGSVAASARRTQTPTANSEAGEQYSRKDVLAYAKLHGIKVVQNNRKWYAETVAAMEKEKRSTILPGMKNVANNNEKVRNALTNVAQYRADRKTSEPKLGDYKTQRGWDRAMASWENKKQNNEEIPKQIIDQARRIALEGGPVAVQQFMNEQGHPKHDAWCGDFAASVVKSVGGKVPQNPQIASNWRNFGHQVEIPKPGDIAVRKQEYHGRRGSGITGDAGSHVTLVENFDPDNPNTFMSIGGNQGKFHAKQIMEKYEFFRATETEQNHDSEKQTAAAKTSGTAGDRLLSKVNDTMQSVEAKRAKYHQNPDIPRKPDSDTKQTTYLNNLSDKQKQFALAKTEAANPNLGKKVQIYDGRDRVVSLPGKNQWVQGGPNSAGPNWANRTTNTQVASKANLGAGFKRLTEQKQKIAQVHENVASKRKEIAERPKVNIAQNGAISGGKKVAEKAEPKKEQPVQVASKEPSSSNKSTQSTGYRSRETTQSSVPYNNSADSIPPSPSDDGSGDYKRCLI